MNVYVSNIPTRMKEDDLKALFIDFGDVIEARIIPGDAVTSNGMVEMADEDAARNAVESLKSKGYVCKLV